MFYFPSRQPINIKHVMNYTSEKIVQFLEKKKQGLNINDHIQQQREFHNPEILEKVISHFSINQYGSNVIAHEAIQPANYYKNLANEQTQERRNKF
jgi:hypothetical protein